MTFVYDATIDRSDLVILDAQDLTRPPTATIHLPRRVPYGFHGNWLPDA
jgi:carotenoid cleavage dioxygenase-like enzyme